MGVIPIKLKGDSAEATRVDQLPKMDGTLDDPLWQSAKAISDFRQREPYEGVVEGQGSPNNEGSDFDPGWDGVWTSEARITADGWMATVEIPFNTLNFTKSENAIWGLNFKRFIRRKNEQDLWKACERRFGLTKVS